jgi:hypothetical protein
LRSAEGNVEAMTYSNRHRGDFDQDDYERSSFSATNASERARALLSQHPHFWGRVDTFEFELTQDRLVVKGRVPTYYLKQLLQNARQKLDGVRVDNRVEVVRPERQESEHRS